MATSRQAMNPRALFAVLRIGVGIFFLAEALSHIGWLSSDQPLLSSLQHDLESATFNRWYLVNVAIPYVSIWSKLIFAGELCIGVSLILGVLAQISIPIALLLVLNFHFTTGAILHWTFFGNPYGLLLVVCLVVLFLGRAGDSYSLSVKR